MLPLGSLEFCAIHPTNNALFSCKDAQLHIWHKQLTVFSYHQLSKTVLQTLSLEMRHAEILYISYHASHSCSYMNPHMGDT